MEQSQRNKFYQKKLNKASVYDQKHVTNQLNQL